MTKLVAALTPVGLPLVWLVTVAVAVPASPTASPSPSSTPGITLPPTATPPHGTVNLGAAAGTAGGRVTVVGAGFFPGEPIVIFIDGQDRSLGGAVADQQGNFRQDVTIPDGTAAGPHQVCVAQQPQPRCARFEVQAAPPPPTPTPTASPSPTTAGGADLTPGQTRPTGALGPFLTSPLGILLILFLLAALIGSIYFILRARGPKGPPLPTPPVIRHRTSAPGRPGAPVPPGARPGPGTQQPGTAGGTGWQARPGGPAAGGAQPGQPPRPLPGAAPPSGPGPGPTGGPAPGRPVPPAGPEGGTGASHGIAPAPPDTPRRRPGPSIEPEIDEPPRQGPPAE